MAEPRTKDLPALIKKIEKQEDSHEFKETILRITQLYFDGLVDIYKPQSDQRTWPEQSKALDALLKGVRLTVSGFYRHDKAIPFVEIKKEILPHSLTFIKHGSNKDYKMKHLERCESELYLYAESIAQGLAGEKIDLIIPVASGGFEPAALAADYLNIEKMLPVRYSNLCKCDIDVLIPTQAPKGYSGEQIIGKRILIIDDIVSLGKTIELVSRWAIRYTPASIHFAVVRGNFPILKEIDFYEYKGSRHLYLYRNKTSIKKKK